ncbi:MAG: endopeptidase La, partial [Acidimicrobiia bacterium]|nr:endopeptidase La [Acidimicrobiia bacterium]
EITLSGRILPIGGVKEKVLGAVRAGIDTVVLPKENEADLEDLPEEIRNRVTIHLVDELGEALAHTLRGGEFREGKLRFASAPTKPGGSSPPVQH